MNQYPGAVINWSFFVAVVVDIVGLVFSFFSVVTTHIKTIDHQPLISI